MEDSNFQLIKTSTKWSCNVSPVPKLVVSSQVPESLWRGTYEDVLEHHAMMSNCYASGWWACAVAAVWALLPSVDSVAYDHDVELICMTLSVFLPIIFLILVFRRSRRALILKKWKHFVELQQLQYKKYGITVVPIEIKRKDGSTKRLTVGSLVFSTTTGSSPTKQKGTGQSGSWIRWFSRPASSQEINVDNISSMRSSFVEDLKKLADLKASGDLTEEEFLQAKARILKSHVSE